MDITADALVAACADEAEDAGIVIRTALEPLAGPGAPTKPASYRGGKYQTGRRWKGTGEDASAVDVVVIDNHASQANRHEAQLERLAVDLGMPTLVLDLSGLKLPPHLPEQLTSYRFPHRHADAYLRDAMLDGTPFFRTEIGRQVAAATVDKAGALLQWSPQSLLYGFWQSHLGKKGSQAKMARSWVSEIVGWEPATLEGTSLGLKGDPLNLSVDDKVLFDEDDQSDWTFAAGEKKVAGVKGKKQDTLANLGHGQVPAESSLVPLSFRAIVQQSSVSFAALRRVHVGAADANAAGRALLVALGVVGHVAAFGRGFHLRSGCELRPVSTVWTWLGGDADIVTPDLSLTAALTLFDDVVARAEGAGLSVGSAWRSEPVVLQPSASLLKVIVATYPSAE